ncbi:MAG TPA: TIGR00725 family protein [Anaerolineae bacterium]|nr:TIGR00725 family protein [Anaerolineae bacterium]
MRRSRRQPALQDGGKQIRASDIGPLVAVVGGSSATPEETTAAEAVGQALAEGGAVLLCGGRGGVMEAACRGAKRAGGLTIGILPGTDVGQANPYVDLPIVTGMGEARNVIIARTAQAVVAVGGSYGTLSEIAYALRFGVPVVGLGTWRIEREGHPPAPIHRARSAEEAAALALALAT